MPMRQRSPIVQPWRMAPWPTVTSSPTVRRESAAGDVDAGQVLDVRARADADRADVAAEDGAEPDAGLVAELDVADDASRWARRRRRGRASGRDAVEGRIRAIVTRPPSRPAASARGAGSRRDRRAARAGARRAAAGELALRASACSRATIVDLDDLADELAIGRRRRRGRSRSARCGPDQTRAGRPSSCSRPRRARAARVPTSVAGARRASASLELEEAREALALHLLGHVVGELAAPACSGRGEYLKPKSADEADLAHERERCLEVARRSRRGSRR